MAGFVIPREGGAEVAEFFVIFGLAEGDGEVGDFGSEAGHELIEFGIVRETLVDLGKLFPCGVVLVDVGHSFSSSDSGFDGGDVFENLAELGLAVGIILDGSSESVLAFEDFAVVLLGEEAVEVVAELYDDAAGVDHLVDFDELGILRPNFGRAADFHPGFFGISFGKVAFGEPDMHVAGAGVGGDGGFGFGGVEVIGGTLEYFDLLGDFGVVLDVQGVEEDIGTTDEIENLALFGAGKGVDGGHEFADDKGFGEALGGRLEFFAFDEEEEDFDSFINVADGFVSE